MLVAENTNLPPVLFQCLLGSAKRLLEFTLTSVGILSAGLCCGWTIIVL